MKLSLRCAAVVMACAFFVGSASAVGLSFGLKGGLNLAKPWGGDKNNPMFAAEGLTMKPGMVAAAAWDINIVEKFSIQPEILFSMKGAKNKVGDIIIVTQFNYIEIPILLKLNIPLGIVVPNVYAAPALGIRAGVGGATKAGDEKVDFTEETVDLIKDQSGAVDFGLAMGAGVNFKAGPGSIVLDLRYTLGLLKIAKLTQEEKDAGAILPKEKNGAFSIMVGYMFEIGG
ncbi:MAG: PorT family protein [Chitinispirillaceae bacterium]|nr:PorT family protein [Chitinispirillaceae bacterium]